jgi:putative salt-induced outer membrane protein YdiY
MTANSLIRAAVRLTWWASMCGALLTMMSIETVAHAQTPPSGLMKTEAATSGSTEVATSGFEGAAKFDAAAKTDATEAKIQAGGMGTSGNSRVINGTASAQGRLRRDANQGSAVLAANYGRSPVEPTDRHSKMKTGVENYQGKLRYDRFITERFTIFGAISARRDRFQNLNLRLNIDPGVAYYFITERKQQFWGELGYDFQYDIRTQKAVDAAAALHKKNPDNEEIDKTEVRHSARLFAGYANNLTENFALSTGLEYLQGIPETTNWRLNWDLGMTSKIAGNFSMAVTFGLKYDHNPLPKIADTDTCLAVSLVYQLI